MSRIEDETRSEQEERREAWFEDLREFIVEANTKTWAGDAPKVESEREGYNEYEYERGEWRIRDSFTGDFQAPGTTTIYFKGKTAWIMHYAGKGMTEGKEELSGKTFTFLKKALMQVSTKMPYRGPEQFQENDFKYRYEVIDNNIEDFLGIEEIHKGNELIFTQTVLGGLVRHKGENNEVLYPWNL